MSNLDRAEKETPAAIVYAKALAGVPTLLFYEGGDESILDAIREAGYNHAKVQNRESVDSKITPRQE